MFTDLVASTELAERLGPDSARVLFQQHFGALKDALAVHRGTEVKSLGDGIMAVFDSVVDGLACAVTMQRAMIRQNRLAPGRELAMRVGIGVGEAIRDGEDWHGPPVVEAARLCARAGGGEICVSELVRLLAAGRGLHRFEPLGQLQLKGIAGATTAWNVNWDADEEFALRVAIADDSVLLRQGIASVLTGQGIDVVLEASDGDSMVRGLEAARPHVAMIDMRMPPTHTREGLDLARLIRARHPEVGVLVLSAAVDPATARLLLADVTHGVGYLLKDRIMEMEELTSAIRTVASGGSAIDPEVLALLG